MATQLPRIPRGVTGLRKTKIAVMMITTFCKTRALPGIAKRCFSKCLKDQTRFMVLHTAWDLRCGKKNGEILNEGKKHEKFTSTLKTYQVVDLYLCCEFCSILFPFGQVALGPACPKQGKQPRCTYNSRSRLQYKTSSQVKRKYEKIGLIRRLINVMLDQIEGIEISSGLGIKLSAAQFKPICHKLTAEETRKNFQREQVFACCIAYLIMCTANLAALYESTSRIWTASPSVFHAHPPFSDGTLLKCLHLIQVCTCVTGHSNKKLLLLKLTQLCMYLESDPLMHVHVSQVNHCKIHLNCIRGSEDHPGLAMRLLLIYIFCCLLALSCWHFHSYSNNLSNIRYTCICSPKSMSSGGSIVISLKSKNVTKVKRHHKIPTIWSTSWAHLQTWRGRKGKAAGVESSTWRAKGWQLEESFRNVAREATRRCRIIQRHVRALNCVPFPMEKWNKFGNTFLHPLCTQSVTTMHLPPLCATTSFVLLNTTSRLSDVFPKMLLRYVKVMSSTKALEGLNFWPAELWKVSQSGWIRTFCDEPLNPPHILSIQNTFELTLNT